MCFLHEMREKDALWTGYLYLACLKLLDGFRLKQAIEVYTHGCQLVLIFLRIEPLLLNKLKLKCIRFREHYSTN
jgi:hypothetical protein